MTLIKGTIMTGTEFFIDPFSDFAFMRRALAACLILAIGGTPLGIFMTLRRMTLMGDAMSHAILPGVATAFIVSGLALAPMAVGGLAAGVAVALCVVFLTRFTLMKEDASFTLLYLVCLAGGVVLISLKGSNVDLLHLLFGNILAIDDDALVLMAGVACVTLLTFAAFYRGFVIECFDPDFTGAAGRGKKRLNAIFFILLVINLISAFLALGTLMALGLMILPALAVRFWTRNIDAAVPLSMLAAVIASGAGLVLSYHTKVPAGPAVVLAAGGISLISAFVGRHGSVLAYARDWE